VNYNYVKVLAKKRTQLIKECLEATLSYFPDEIDSHPFHSEVAQTIETFFLLDHCVEADDETQTSQTGSLQNSLQNVFKTPKKYNVTSESSSSSLGEHNRDGKARLSFKLDDAVGHVVEGVGNTVGSAVGFIKKRIGSGDDEEKNNKKAERSLAAINTSVTTEEEPIFKSLRSPVVPYTRKTRRSVSSRAHDEDELNEVGDEANLLLDDDRSPTELVPSYSHPVPNFQSPGTKLGDLLENNPMIFMLIAAASVAFLKFACKLTVAMDLDILLLLIWASFCVGLHTPRPMVVGIDKTIGPSTTRSYRPMRGGDRNGRRLLRMSMVGTPDSKDAPSNGSMTFDAIRDEEEQDEVMEVNQSPLPRFPIGAALGSKLNCWSEPVCGSFRVRGPQYLTDKKKIPSGPFVFPVRGVDLFLTDSCPENAGRYVT
jgi:hypothetical protein